MRLNGVAEVDSTYSIKKLVARNEGFSILSWHAVQEEVERGELRALSVGDPAITRSIDLAINPLRRADPSVAAVRTALVEMVRTRMREASGREVDPKPGTGGRRAVRPFPRPNGALTE